MVTGIVSPDGSISETMLIAAKACVEPGLHKLILESEDGLGRKLASTVYVILGSNCVLDGLAEQLNDGSWRVKGIRFDYQKWDLRPETKSTLSALKTWLKGAKNIHVSGYTETDGRGLYLRLKNKVLAMKRAMAIIQSLKILRVGKGLSVKAVGPLKPISKVQAKNRRVELRVRF